MMQSEFPINSVRICIDTENPESGELSGKICGIALKESILFQSRNDLVIKIDAAFNDIGQPQPHQIIRSFKEKNDNSFVSYTGQPQTFFSSEEIRAQHGLSRTIDFIMTSRKRAEWQGILKSPEGEVLHRFQSTLKCMEYL